MPSRLPIPAVLLGAILAGWIAGCAELPQPFHDRDNPLARPEETIDVAVEPLTGVPAPLARHVAAAVTYHLGQIDIPATDAPVTGARYRLRGAVEPADGSAAEVRAAVIRWTLLDAEGNAVGVHDQDILGPTAAWEGGDPYLIGRVGADAAQALAQVVADAESGIEGPAVASLVIETVRGAPGDGNQALTAAIRRALSASGYPVVDAGRPAAYRLIGEVEITPAAAGRQTTSIVWRIVALDGTEGGRAVGRAAQRNVVPAGSLDGTWGEAARAIAEAAVPGIGEVLRRDGAEPQGAALHK